MTTRNCVQCGQPLPESTKFCGQCGAVNEPAAAPAAPAPAAVGGKVPMKTLLGVLPGSLGIPAAGAPAAAAAPAPAAPAAPAAAASKLPMKTMLGFAPQMGAIPGAPASTAPVPGAPGLAPGFHSAPTPLAPPVS